MTNSVSYELYRQQRGRWVVDSVYDDKEMALYEAKKLLNAQFRYDIKVVEEKFNAGSGETVQRVIFTGRGVEDAKRKVEQVKKKQAERIEREHVTPVEKKKDNLTPILVRAVLILGGLGIVTLAAFYLISEKMG